MAKIAIERRVEAFYEVGTKAFTYRVMLIPDPQAAPGWTWPADLPTFVGEGSSLDEADKAALKAMREVLG